MTLPMAPCDVLRRPPAKSWKYSSEASRRRAGKLPQARPSDFSILAGNFVWLWTLVAALFAIVLPALLNNTSFPFRASGKEESEKTANKIPLQFTFDAFSRMQMPQFALEENPLAPISLVYQGNNLYGAKSLFSDKNFAPLNSLLLAGPKLEDAVQFHLGEPTADEKLTSPGNQTKPKNARLASRLARVTVYWPEEGDFYTRNRKSSTGTRLRDGHCAVDPKVIPYGSVVNVPGVGRLIAVDTGGAVVSRRAARVAGRTREQRSAIVIDIFCSTRAKAKALVKRVKHFAVVTWQRPERVAGL
jgi:3D (Asp-Asp-Asp) domain-containing protein